jgi:hypothetical protein
MDSPPTFTKTIPTKNAKHKKKKLKKKIYSSRCTYPGCQVKYNETGLSFHQLPKNANQEQRDHWANVLPSINESDPSLMRICSKHFRSEDFIRDLRNEMLGLPLRNLLKPGSYPILPQANSMEKEEQDQGIESTDLGQDSSRSKSSKQHLSSSHQKMSEQISREVDILTEIAELQMKLDRLPGSC